MPSLLSSPLYEFEHMRHNSIVYLAHSSLADRHAAKFSVLTLLRQLDQFDQLPQIIVYTDSPAYFEGMDVLVEDLDPCIIDIWKQERNNDDFLKWHVIEDFFKTYHGNMLWIDPYMLWNEDAIELLNADGFANNIVYRSLGPLQKADLPDLTEHLYEILKVNSGQLIIDPQMEVFDTRVLGIKEADSNISKNVFKLMDVMLGHSNYGALRQIAASKELKSFGEVSLCNAWTDMMPNKLVNDQILNDFFWSHADLPMEQLLPKLRETEQLIVSSPTSYNRNILRMMREMILA